MAEPKKTYNAFIIPHLLPSKGALVFTLNPPNATNDPRGGLPWLQKYYDQAMQSFAEQTEIGVYSAWKDINAYGSALREAKVDVKVTPLMIFNALCGLGSFQPFGGISLNLPKMFVPVVPGLKLKGHDHTFHLLDYKFKGTKKTASGEEVFNASIEDLLGWVDVHDNSLEPPNYVIWTLEELFDITAHYVLEWSPLSHQIYTKTKAAENYLKDNFPSGTPVLVNPEFFEEFPDPKRRLPPDEKTSKDLIKTTVILSPVQASNGEWAVTVDLPRGTGYLRPFELAKYLVKLTPVQKKSLTELVHQEIPFSIVNEIFKTGSAPKKSTEGRWNNPSYPFEAGVEGVLFKIEDFVNAVSIRSFFGNAINPKDGVEILNEGLDTGELRMIFSKNPEFRPTKDGKILEHWIPLSKFKFDLPLVRVTAEDIKSVLNSTNNFEAKKLFESAFTHVSKEVETVAASGTIKLAESYEGETRDILFSPNNSQWYLLLFKNLKFLDSKINELKENLTDLKSVLIHNKLLIKKLFEQ